MTDRLVPIRNLPPYSYLPGQSPHPISDPAGHSYGHRQPPPLSLDPERWRDSEDYLFGIDLFNHGYYWEAHEIWEGLWLAAGRMGVIADFLKGLIQLTAAGVKVRQKMPVGVASLGAGAAGLFQRVLDTLEPARRRFLGLNVAELLHFAQNVAARPEAWNIDESVALPRVFPLVLRPAEEEV